MKRNFFLMGAVGATLLLAAFPSIAQTAPNKPGETIIEIPNSGFEQGLTAWDLRDGANQTYRVASKADSFVGNGGAQIVLDENSDQRLRQAAYFARRDLPTTAGYYRLQLAARTDLKQGNFGANLIVQDEDKKLLLSMPPGSNGVPVLQGKTDWQEISFVYRLPAGVKTTILQLQVVNALGTVSIDDVRLVQLDDATGKLLMNAQSPQAPTLEEAGAKMLDAPCRIINARLATLYRDPVTGRTNMAINSCTPGQGSALLVDYQVNQSTVIPFPVGEGGWDLIQTAPDRMLFESLGPLHMVPVDLKTRAVASAGIKAVPGNDYAWRFTKGADGWIYMGSYPTAHLYRYHPETFAVEDMGFMGPKGNLYNRFVGATSDGWVLSTMMMETKGVTAFNPQTKEQYNVENAIDENGAGVAANLVDVGGIVYAPLRGELHQFDANQRKFVPALLPPAPGGAKWNFLVPSSTPARKVLRSGSTYYVVEEGKAPLPVWNLDLRGGTLVGVDEKNQVIGFRGQDYFVAPALAKEIVPRPAALNPPPVGMHFLRADPEGGVTGGPNFGQTLFRFDPARKLLENTPQVVDGGGEVYDGRWVDGKFYFIAYSGGELTVWDPAQPWDQWNGKNPKVLYSYKTPKDGEQIRPIGGLVVGPRGRLYSGWSAKYGKKGGALGEYDLATKQARSWQNDLFAPEMSIGHITADDKYVYGLTANSFSGITPPAKPVVFWVFDPIAEKVVFTETLADATGMPGVERVPGTNHIWLAEPKGLRRFDPQTLKWAQTLAWPKPAGAPATVSASDASGNSVWFTAGPTVVRVDDGATPSAHAIFTAPKAVGSMAATDGQLYFTQGVEVWSAPQKAR